MDGYYDKWNIGFFVIIFNPETGSLVKWLDHSFKSRIRYRYDLDETKIKTKVRKLKLRNLLTQKDELISEVGVDMVGIRRNKAVPKNIQKHVTEHTVNYILDYFQEKQITPGTWVQVNADGIKNKDTVSSQQLAEIEDRLLGEHASLVELALINIPLLTQDMPSIPRIAFDIEVKSPRDIFPVPDKAEFQVHAAAGYDNSGRAIQYILGLSPSAEEKRQIEHNLGMEVEIKVFLDERQMLLAMFDDFSRYPIVITYNGDGFDLPYLQQRAIGLGLDPPIYEGHYRGGQLKEYHLKNTIHLDLLKFFKKAEIRLYAFGGKYTRNRLEDVGKALVGESKIQHDLWFDEMSLVELVTYNIQDAKLTYELTAFSDNLTFDLIFSVMRIIKGTFSFVNRVAISKWILNWIAFEHRNQGALIPKSVEIIKYKGGYESAASSEGKAFKGAIVLEPKAGIWWDVAVLDYASLYPSVIEKYNLSYETIKCHHIECQSNIVPSLKHWVCEKEGGIMSSLVGYVKEVRVRWFKPLTGDKDQRIATQSNTIQAALKVLINASYGVYGNKDFPLHCPPVAESTTAYARNAFLRAKSEAEEMGITVLAGDTDSIFLHKLSKEQEMRLRIWSMVDIGIELGVDYYFRFLILSDRKKNYFGITTDGKIITKGLQVKKSNTAQFIQDIYQEITQMLMTVNTPEELEDAKGTMVRLLQTKIAQIQRGDLNFAKLAKLTSMKKNFKDYETNTEAVQIAVQMLRDGKESDIIKGHQWLTVKVKPFKFTVRTSKFSFLEPGLAIRCSTKEVSKVRGIGEIDIDHYLKALKKSFVPIFDSFDLDWDATINGYQDVTKYFELGY